MSSDVLEKTSSDVSAIYREKLSPAWDAAHQLLTQFHTRITEKIGAGGIFEQSDFEEYQIITAGIRDRVIAVLEEVSKKNYNPSSLITACYVSMIGHEIAEIVSRLWRSPSRVQEFIGTQNCDLSKFVAPFAVESIWEEGKVDLSLSTSAVTREIEGTHRRFGDRFESGKYSFSCNVPFTDALAPSDGYDISHYKNLSTRAFNEIFTNAFRAMPDGGEITVNIDRVDNDVVVAISDTGDGIAPENLGRVTDIGFTTKGEVGGTGKGMYYLKQYFEEILGGKLEIESEGVGKGTTVRVILPSAENLSPDEKEMIERHFRGGKKLSVDFVNAYNAHLSYVMMGQDYLKSLQPIQSYEDYFIQSNPKHYPYTMELSDPDAVSALNGLVTAFNSDLERIKNEKDVETAKKFLNDIDGLVRSKK